MKWSKMIDNKIVIFLVMLLAAMNVNARQWSVSELPNVQVQDHTKHFVNPDGIVSAETGAQIDSLLLDARRKSSAEIVAVIVDDIDSDIDTYATELFNTWGIGKKDKNNGILIVVAKDARQAVIRTGYGAEGIMPDIAAARIRRNFMNPHFKENDYDGGMLAGVQEVHRIVTDPDARAELASEMADNYHNEGASLIKTYLWLGVIAAVGLLIWLLFMILTMHSKDHPMSDYQKCQYLKKNQLIFWVIALVFIGIPILAPLMLTFLQNYYRNHKRRCPQCRTQMEKLNETEDNKYLDYAQDLEERIKSVDYDVWLCPNCGEKDIYSFVNTSSNYKQCPKCHAHTERLNGTRIIQEPTYRKNGYGEKMYSCLNCGNTRSERYSIPKKEPPVVAVGGMGGRGRGGGFGGGGFGGGFGGGLTGGGGSSGGW